MITWNDYNDDYEYSLSVLKPRPWGYEHIVTFRNKHTDEYHTNTITFQHKPTKDDINNALKQKLDGILNPPIIEESRNETKIYTEDEILNILKDNKLIDSNINDINGDFLNKMKEYILNTQK